MAFGDGPYYGLPTLGPEFYDPYGIQPGMEETAFAPQDYAPPMLPTQLSPRDLIQRTIENTIPSGQYPYPTSPINRTAPAEYDPRNPFAIGSPLSEDPWYLKVLSFLRDATAGSDWGTGPRIGEKLAREGVQKQTAGRIRGGFKGGTYPSEAEDPRAYAAGELGSNLRRKADLEEFLAIQAALGRAGKGGGGLTLNNLITQYRGALSEGLYDEAEALRQSVPELMQIFPKPYSGPRGVPARAAEERGHQFDVGKFGYGQEQDYKKMLHDTYGERIQENKDQARDIRLDMKMLDKEIETTAGVDTPEAKAALVNLQERRKVMRSSLNELTRQNEYYRSLQQRGMMGAEFENAPVPESRRVREQLRQEEENARKSKGAFGMPAEPGGEGGPVVPQFTPRIPLLPRPVETPRPEYNFPFKPAPSPYPRSPY